MSNGKHNQTDDVLTTAMAVKTAQAIDTHLGNVQQITRMALDESTDAVQSMRDEVIESLRKTNELNASLIEQLAELLTFFKDHVAQVPIVNVPQANVTLEQQPITINVPKSAISVNPVVNVPEAQIKIDHLPVELPTSATINHSDGTQSTIRFKD